MVMGHVGFGVLFDKWIHGFHMPIWFFISSCFLDTSKSMKLYILKKTKTLLVPYLCFGLFYEVLWSVISGAKSTGYNLTNGFVVWWHIY